MPTEVRLQLRLPTGVSIVEVREMLLSDERAFVETHTWDSDAALYTDTSTLIQFGLLVINAPVGAKYLLDLIAMLRRREPNPEPSTSGIENALIVDGVKYPLSETDATVLRELLQ